MNEFESDWISLSQSQSGVRVFLSESDNNLNPRWQCLPSSSWVRMNEWCFLCKWWGGKCEYFFLCKWLGTNLGKCESAWISESKMVESNMARIEDDCHHQDWVRINEFESNWISFSQSFVQNGCIQDCRIQDGCHHQVEFRMNEWSFLCANGGNQSWQVWVSLRVNTKIAESKMVEFKLAEFKMAAIIKLGEKEWVWVRLNYVESESEWSESVFEWIWEKITRCLNPRWQWLNPAWQNSRWLPSSSWVTMNEWSLFCAKWLNPRWLSSSSWLTMYEFESDWISFNQSFVQNGWIKDGRIQDGRIQDGCHHQVESEWMSDDFLCK